MYTCTVDSIELRTRELCCYLHYCFDTVAGRLVMNSQTAFADETAGLQGLSCHWACSQWACVHRVRGATWLACRTGTPYSSFVIWASVPRGILLRLSVPGVNASSSASASSGDSGSWEGASGTTLLFQHHEHCRAHRGALRRQQMQLPLVVSRSGVML